MLEIKTNVQISRFRAEVLTHLKSSLGRTRLGRLLGGGGLSALSSLTSFASFAGLSTGMGTWKRESRSWVSHHASRCKLANNTGKRYRTRSSTIKRWIRSAGVSIGSAWCRPRRPRNFRRRRGLEDRRCAVQSAHHG